MKDIAERANVSMITVSRVVNNSGYVSAETRRRVEAVIKELNYVPNMVASNLRSRQSDLLALILPDITNTFWTSIARGVEDEAWAAGYGVFICNTDSDFAKEESYIERLLRRRVEGVLIVPTPTESSHTQLQRLRQHGVHFVVIHRPLFDLAVDVVRSEGVRATKRLTEELIKTGRRRIGFVGLPFTDRVNEDRLKGYQEALREADIPFDPTIIRSNEVGREAGGYNSVQDLLEVPEPPDALVLANSRLAVGGLQALADAGLSIPDDIGVAAFHDISAMDPYASRLIRAVQPSYKMGQMATRRLLEIGGKNGGPSQEIVLEPQIFLPIQQDGKASLPKLR
jgi:LacI family transcriptional regulator